MVDFPDDVAAALLIALRRLAKSNAKPMPSIVSDYNKVFEAAKRSKPNAPADTWP